MRDIFICIQDLNFKQSNLTYLNLIFSKLTLLKIDAYLLKFQERILFCLLACLMLSMGPRIPPLKFCAKKILSITNLRLLNPKTHIIDWFYNISAKWNNFYFA